MTQVSASADYSTLKENLLQMWLPVAGARNINDVILKNCVKYMGDMVENFMGEEVENYSELLKFKVVFTALANKMMPKESNCRNDHFERNVGCCFDTNKPFQLDETILTGSYSEGLFLFFRDPPDMDLMCVLKNIIFTQKDQENGSLSFREDTPFVNAFIKNKETRKLWTDFLEDEHKNRENNQLSSRKLKEKLQENYEKSEDDDLLTALCKENWQLEEVAEGAAVTIRKTISGSFLVDVLEDVLKKIANSLPNDNPLSQDNIRSLINLFDLVFTLTSVSSDIVLCIFCEGWPSCAQEWSTRERLWPDIKLVENITQGGFHVVPKSSPDGNFRLSFSRAETMLIEALTPLQHRVMRAFKTVVKYHQDSWSPSVKSILSSYHIKTIAFWHFEKTSQESWSEETMVHHLVTLLEGLAEALRRQHLPMYFMPKVNLLQDVDHELSLHLMEKIWKLSYNFSALSEALEKHSALCKMLILTHIPEKEMADNVLGLIPEIFLKMLILKTKQYVDTCF